MSLPREELPGRSYTICRRCVLRFLLRPDAVTNNTFIYRLGEAAQWSGIDVILPVAMSNHYHVVIYDGPGRYPEFMYRFHQVLARALDAHRGRWEYFWADLLGPPRVCSSITSPSSWPRNRRKRAMFWDSPSSAALSRRS